MQDESYSLIIIMIRTNELIKHTFDLTHPVTISHLYLPPSVDVAPANILSYYSRQASMQWDFEWTPAAIVKNIATLLTGDVSAIFTASGSVEVMAYAIDEVIEFRSADKSGVYKPNDTIVSRVNYETDNVMWTPMSVESDATGGKTVITAVTEDKVHTYVWTMAGQYASLDNGAVLTPNSTKLDVTIQYPFKAQDTNLAIRMVLMGASATGAVAASFDASAKQATAGNSYISWVGKANTNLGLVDVTASASSDTDASYFNKNNNILSSLKGIAAAGGDVKAYLKLTYFSFPVTAAHGYILWDPSIGYGVNPANAGLSGAAIAGIVVGSVILLGLVGFFVVRHRRRNQSPLLSSGGYA